VILSPGLRKSLEMAKSTPLINPISSGAQRLLQNGDEPDLALCKHRGRFRNQVPRPPFTKRTLAARTESVKSL